MLTCRHPHHGVMLYGVHTMNRGEGPGHRLITCCLYIQAEMIDKASRLSPPCISENQQSSGAPA
eukprot:8152429-Karenia_brevis.AAC.1